MSSTDIGDVNEPETSGAASASPKELASDAVHAVKQEAANFASDAKEKASQTLDDKKEAASHTLGDFANAVRKAGDDLAQSDQSMASQFVRQTADGLESFARAISDKRPEELLDSVREFGRRNPTAFIAGSVLAGFALGRLLRSSESHQDGDLRGASDTFTAPGGAPPYPSAEMAPVDISASPDQSEVSSPPGDAETFQPGSGGAATAGTYGEPDHSGGRG